MESIVVGSDILYAPSRQVFILFHDSLMTYRFLFCLIFLNNILVSISEEQQCQVLDDNVAVEMEILKFKTWIKAEEKKSAT